MLNQIVIVGKVFDFVEQPAQVEITIKHDDYVSGDTNYFKVYIVEETLAKSVIERIELGQLLGVNGKLAQDNNGQTFVKVIKVSFLGV